MKISNPQKCHHCSVIYKSRNALFEHLRLIGCPNLKPPRTDSEIIEARRRRREKLSFIKLIKRLERVSLK